MPFWIQKARSIDAPPRYEPLQDELRSTQVKEHIFDSQSTESFDSDRSTSYVRISKRIIILVSTVFAITLVILAAVLSSRTIQKPWPVPEFGHSTKIFESMEDWEYGPNSANLWNSVLGDNGFIVIKDWQRYGLKEGIDTQVSGAKIYGISATHQFHCLNMIRDAFLGLATRDPEYVQMHKVSSNFSEELAYKPRHIFHCLDYLRQTVMCNADTTLEWRSDVDPEHIDGYGPPHQCKNWDEVRTWLGDNMPPDAQFHHQGH